MLATVAVVGKPADEEPRVASVSSRSFPRAPSAGASRVWERFAARRTRTVRFSDEYPDETEKRYCAEQTPANSVTALDRAMSGGIVAIATTDRTTSQPIRLSP